MSRLCRCAVFVLWLTPTAALADWQFTQWGMSEQELVATGPSIVPTNSSERKGHSNPNVGEALYKSGFQPADILFTAFYVFRYGKLVRVTLHTADLKDWPLANLALEQIHGKPFEDKSHSMSGGAIFCTVTDRKWRDEKAGNSVRAFGINCENGNSTSKDDFFAIHYDPILSSSGTASERRSAATPHR